MIYEEIKPLNREEAERAFRDCAPTDIVKALLSSAFHNPDWQWVQERCLELLNNPSETVRGVAITCLGHLARIHGKLDLAIVLPALQAMRSQPALIGKLEDALDDILMYIKRT